MFQQPQLDTKHSPSRISYWLIPGEPYLTQLRSVIAELAHKFGGPVFEPHLTVYSGGSTAFDQTPAIVEQAAQRKSLTLKTAGLSFSDNYNRSCCIDFLDSSDFSATTAKVQSQQREPEKYDRPPHLSLFYGTLPAEQQQYIREHITIPTAISFESLVAVSQKGPTKSPKDVQAWREVSRVRLSG